MVLPDLTLLLLVRERLWLDSTGRKHGMRVLCQGLEVFKVSSKYWLDSIRRIQGMRF